ncbi:MAG: hypothetical protein CVU95_00310 [Firmicutes bacterium HGW-Firmicutes-2]|jgi:probable DNA metabolism protein|nr:MAG: hypothetical protein CVU95_00310 [Firmicutes bacterium HGW-Firmicutes-2]
MIYLYDGQFDGFLTCIYHHYYDEKCDGIYEEKTYDPKLFEITRFIKTDSDKSTKVHQAMLDQFSEYMYFNIYHTFLSNIYDKDTMLLNCLEIAFKHGLATDRMRTLDAIFQVLKIGRQVGFEKHRFMGLLRFSDLGHYLYARFEPDHNIISLLGEHFSDRFREEKFIIHDVRRAIAIIGHKGQWLVTDFNHIVDDNLLDEEIFFRKLWQTYFDKIAIEDRTNLKLQQNFIPKKYRKHLLEFGANTNKSI